MKIAMLVRALPVHRMGGLELHTWDLAKGLVARGHEVHLFTSAAAVGFLPVPLGLEIHHVTRGRPGDYTLAFWREIGRELCRVHGRERFDLVHSQEFAGMFLGRLDVPLVCTIHGTLTTEVPLDRRYFGRLSVSEKAAVLWQHKARIALQRFFRRMLRRANAIVVDSEFTREEVERIVPGAPITKVELGPDAARYDFGGSGEKSRGAFTIVLLGRVQKQKGVGVALEAARMLRERGMKFRMEIGGRGEYEGEARRVIGEWGLADRVYLRGFVKAEDISRFLRQGDVFLFPDLTQPAFGLVAVEAMLHGLPVIGARSGAIPEVVTPEVGWTYDPWNVRELADLIERVSKAPDEVAAKRLAASEQVRKYTAERMAQEVERVYLAVI